MPNKLTKLTWLSISALILALGTAACGDSSSENTPNGNDGGNNQSQNDGGGNAGTSAGNAGHGGNAGSAGTGNVDQDDGGITDGGNNTSSDGAVRDGGQQLDCFDGKATTDKQYLNHCTSSQCEPFDNATYVPRYTPGQPLTPIP